LSVTHLPIAAVNRAIDIWNTGFAVWRFRGACQEGRDANRSLCARRENAVILLFCYSGYRECRMMLRPGIDTANPAFHSVR
jgi:hypothetical protein